MKLYFEIYYDHKWNCVVDNVRESGDDFKMDFGESGCMVDIKHNLPVDEMALIVRVDTSIYEIRNTVDSSEIVSTINEFLTIYLRNRKIKKLIYGLGR